MHKDKRKRTILLVIVTLSTMVLGMIAVITALRLRELATVPVAPNVPQSQPLAAQPGTVTVNGCFATIIIPPQACADACNTDADCGAQGSITLRCMTVAGQTGKMCVNPACATNTTTCVCAPTATVTPVASPTVTPTVTPGPSPTPGPSATPTPEPTATPTQPAVPTSTPVPPASCNDSCSTTSDCTNGLTCVSGMCRNSVCSNETDCVCPVTQTPPPELPQAGVNLPGLMVLSGGMLLILIGLLGVWAW